MDFDSFEESHSMPTPKSEARLNFRLSADLKRTIEEAAAQLGQTVSDFAVGTLVQTARRVIRERNVTVVSQRDRKALLQMLDDDSAKPNKALSDAARRYKRKIG
jgi:uncharacterized protein (DUF1778 family)